MTEPLHEDRPDHEEVRPDGTVVRVLSAEEYEATYVREGATPCHPIPEDVLARIEAELDEQEQP